MIAAVTPRIRFVLPALAVALIATAGCSPAPESADRAGSAAARPATLAPDFELENLDGAVVRLSDSAGQVRLIDFWATWCAPCIEEIPMFKELHEEYAGQGFTLLAVSMDEAAPQVREVVEQFEIPYVNVIGNDEVAGNFGGVLGLPTAFLVDRDGKIVKEYFGPKSRKKLEGEIRRLLGLEPVT